MQLGLVKLLPLLALLPQALAWFPTPDGPTVNAKRAGDAYTVDFQDGVNTQVESGVKPDAEVEYTTDGGTPVAHPYEYQRIGSNGAFHCPNAKSLSYCWRPRRQCRTNVCFQAHFCSKTSI